MKKKKEYVRLVKLFINTALCLKSNSSFEKKKKKGGGGVRKKCGEEEGKKEKRERERERERERGGGGEEGGRRERDNTSLKTLCIKLEKQVVNHFLLL